MIHYILNKFFWGIYRHFASDELYARFRFYLSTGRRLHLDTPVTLSDKINWIKLHDRSEIRKKVADRLQAREFVKEKIGSKYLIPLIGAYDELTIEIWEQLPDRFVIKANHGSGMIEIVHDKKSRDPQKIINLTRNWQQTDYAEFGREWVYKDLPRTIIVEELLETEENRVPDDYKFFCFHGRVEIFQIDFDRYGDHRRNFYDRSFTSVPARIIYEPYEGTVEKPSNLDEAVAIADKLSAGFNFVRVDLYLMDNRIYFGELTNFPGNGFEPFTPEKFDRKFGEWVRLDLE